MSGSDLPPASDDRAGQAPARVELHSRVRSLELSLVASDFRTVATGMGELSATVPPGIYQVVARAGPVVDRKLVSLEPGGVHRDDDVAVSFPAAAPVETTSTSHEYHQYFAGRASEAVNQMSGPDCGLVIVVRDVRGTDGPPLTADDVACFGLLDERLLSMVDFHQRWEVQEKEAVATWSGRLRPGGYALRTDPGRLGAGPRSPGIGQPYDQSLWLSAGWQTIVFVTTGPGGPRTSAASVHMTHMGVSWSPYETDVGLALELANWGLREGRSVVPDDLLSVLLGTKFVNPMLGILGAHSLLLRQQPDARLLDVVLHNLDGMLPGNPDVQALRWIATTGRAAEPDAVTLTGMPAAQTPGGATWPPMLLPSYRALIAMDAAHPSAIGNGSPAERAASNLLVQGVWTNWTPLPPVAPPMPVDLAPTGGPAARGAAAAVLPRLAAEPSLMGSVPRTDPGTARVAAYLSALAALEGPGRRVERFATLSSEEIGLATTLPVATVDRALSLIGGAVSPGGGDSGDGEGDGGRGRGDGGGGGGGGLLRGSLLFLATGALLLAGVVGTVAWCAGADECPVQIGGSDATPPPVASESPEPTRAPTTEEPPDATTAPTQPPVEATIIALDHPFEIEFLPVVIGAEPGQQPLTVLAAERVPITFEVADSADGAFQVDPTCQWTEATAGLQCTAVVTFTPQQEGPHVGIVHLLAGTEVDPRPVQVAGEGVPLFIEHPASMQFGSITIGRPVEQALVVVANAEVPIEFSVVEEGAAFSADRGCDWVAVDSGHFECSIDVTFDPPTTDEHAATLALVTPGADARLVKLVGTGINGVD